MSLERNKIPRNVKKNTLSAHTSKLCLCKCAVLASHMWEWAALNLRSNGGGELCRNYRNRRSKAVREQQRHIKIAVRVMFYLKAARIRCERMRAHTLPLRLASRLISSSQPVVMRLHYTSVFTSSAASIIGFWFYTECASVKGRTEGKHKRCASPSLLYLHTHSPCRVVWIALNIFAQYVFGLLKIFELLRPRRWSQCWTEGQFEVCWSFFQCLSFPQDLRLTSFKISLS